MIRSSPFGGTRLTGTDAAAFKRQISRESTNERAIASIRRGIEIIEEMKRNGVYRRTFKPCY